MVIRNVHSLVTTLVLCLLAVAALYAGYLVKTQDERRASVVVEQLKGPAWAVEIEQVPSDQGAQGEAGQEIIVATAE